MFSHGWYIHTENCTFLFLDDSLFSTGESKLVQATENKSYVDRVNSVYC